MTLTVLHPQVSFPWRLTTSAYTDGKPFKGWVQPGGMILTLVWLTPAQRAARWMPDAATDPTAPRPPISDFDGAYVEAADLDSVRVPKWALPLSAFPADPEPAI